MLTLDLQVRAAIYILIYGVLIGLLFDVYRLYRWNTGKQPAGLLTNIQDLLFWLFVTALTFSILVEANWGELRLYVFVFLCLGGYLYFLFISRLFLRLGAKASHFIRKSYHSIVRTTHKIQAFSEAALNAVIAPFRLILHFILLPFAGLARAATLLESFFLGILSWPERVIETRISRSGQTVLSKVAVLFSTAKGYFFPNKPPEN